MTTETIDIRVREDGSRVVSRNVREIGTSADESSALIGKLNAALAALAGGVIVHKLYEMVQSFQEMQNKLKLTTTSQQNLNDVWEELIDISTRTRSSIETNVDLYQRLAMSTKDLGLSQKEILDFTESLNQAIKISGVSATEAALGIRQLTQGLSAGKLQGQDLRAVLEDIPFVGNVIAKGLGVTRGQLRRLGSEGQITAQQIVGAFTKMSGELRTDFAKTIPTLEDSFVKLGNVVLKSVGEFDRLHGISKAISGVVNDLSQNFVAYVQAVVKATEAVIALGAAYYVFQLSVKATDLASRIAEFLSFRKAIADGTVTLLGSAEAEHQRAASLAASAAATQLATAAQVESNVASARNAAVSAEAKVAEIASTQAVITAIREEAIAKLAKANTDVKSAQAAVAASEAAGAQSLALRVLKEATVELEIAETTRNAQLKELALLGAQQARVNTEAAVAASANAAAQRTLAEAQGAAAVANAAAAANTAKTSEAATIAANAAAGSTGLISQAITGIRNAAVAAFAPVLRLLVLINTNPFIALATAITAVIGLLFVFGDDIKAGSDDITTINDVMIEFGKSVLGVFSSIGTTIADAFSGTLEIVSAVFGGIGSIIGSAVTDYLHSFDGFFDGVGGGFTGILKGTARVIDAIAGLLTGLGIGVIRAFAGIPDVVVGIFKNMFNTVASLVEDQINGIIDVINKARSAIGLSVIEAVKVTKLDVDQKVFQDYGKSIAGSIGDGFEQQGGFLEKQVDDVIKRARDRALDRELQPVVITGVRKFNPAQPATPVGPDPKDIEKTTESLRRLLDRIDPTTGALLEMQKAVTILNHAQELHIITIDQEANYLVALTRQYQDIINPLAKVNRDLDNQTRLLSFNAKQREVESQVLQITQDLLDKNVTLTQEETQALREKITALQKLNEITQIQDNLIAGSVDARRQQIEQIQAIKTLLADPTSGFTKGDAGKAVTDLVSNLGLDPTNLKASADANIQGLTDMYAQIDALRQADLISEQDAAALHAQAWVQAQAKRLAGTQNFLENLSQLQHSKNKEEARIGKAAAIAQATIDTYKAATGAYASLANIQYIGPALGAAAAAAAIAAGLENVRAIKSQSAGFMAGGYTGNAPITQAVGPAHGQEYVIDAANTRRLGVSNLDALRSGDADISTRGAGTSASQKGSTRLQVNIQNYGTGKSYEVQQVSEEQIRVIARDESVRQISKHTPDLVASEIANPNSKVSKQMGKSTQAGRRR